MMNDSSSRILFTNHSLTVLTVVLVEDDLDFCVFTRDQSTIVIEKTVFYVTEFIIHLKFVIMWQ